MTVLVLSLTRSLIGTLKKGSLAVKACLFSHLGTSVDYNAGFVPTDIQLLNNPDKITIMKNK